MARKDDQIRQRITEAAAALRSGQPVDQAEAVVWADALDSVLALGGWGSLRRSETEEDPNLSMRMPMETRDAIKAAADQAAAKKPGGGQRNLGKDVDEGFEAFLAGKFVPDVPVRHRRGEAPRTANLNVRPTPELHIQVLQACRERADELGFDCQPMHVAIGWLMKKYRISAKAQ